MDYVTFLQLRSMQSKDIIDKEFETLSYKVLLMGKIY
jgi:hypothetical protein